MFQIVLSLAIGVVIGWNFHMFFISLEPKNVALNVASPTNLSSESNDTSKLIVVKSTTYQKVEPSLPQNSIDQNHSEVSPFQTLLQQNNFSDAMAFYMEADEEQLSEYKLILKAYFYDRADEFPKETIEQILH
ncbi:MAG: hypothetical protein K0U38_11990, partial [Epsilonproteobacteria bacterium]|nr:hypothetical protein [Campylobacterota bacterium]